MDARHGNNMKFSGKPGWFNESFRHYLASKGIRSQKKLYFQSGPNDSLKGNREPGRLKRAYAKGFTKEQLRADPEIRRKFDISLDEVTPKTSSFPQDLTIEQEMRTSPSVPNPLPPTPAVPSKPETTTFDKLPEEVEEEEPQEELQKEPSPEMVDSTPVEQFDESAVGLNTQVSATPEAPLRGYIEPISKPDQLAFTFSKDRFNKRFDSGDEV